MNVELNYKFMLRKLKIDLARKFDKEIEFLKFIDETNSFFFKYKGNSFFLNVSKTNVINLQILKRINSFTDPFLNEFIDIIEQSPVCDYVINDLISLRNAKNYVWANLSNGEFVKSIRPVEVIKELGIYITNINFYNGETMEDYKSLFPEMEYFGMAKGAIANPFKLYESELWTFITLNELTKLGYEINSKIFEKGNFSKEELDILFKIEQSKDFCAACAKNFGISFEEPLLSFRVDYTADFQAWADWWAEFINTKTTDEMQTVIKDLEEGKDCLDFRPGGSWEEKRLYYKELSKKEKWKRIW